MFAVYRDPYLPLWLTLASGMLLFCVIHVLRHYSRTKQISLIAVLATIAGVAILIGLLIPPVARLHREYYQDKDQFEWARILESAEGETRQRAIEALCTLLKRKADKFIVREVALHALVRAQAKEAVPVLTELMRTDDESLRQRLGNAIEDICRPPAPDPQQLGNAPATSASTASASRTFGSAMGDGYLFYSTIPPIRAGIAGPVHAECFSAG
jgi:hypothetical protein